MMVDEPIYNFGKKNIEDITKKIEEGPFPDKVYTMHLNESGNGEKVSISEESRKNVRNLL